MQTAATILFSRYHRKNKLLQQDITSLQSKQHGLVDEIVSQRKKLQGAKAFVRRFARDLTDVARLKDQDFAAYKEGFGSLHGKYIECVEPDASNDAGADGNDAASADIQREYTRQKEYLEKTVESLKRSLKKDAESHR